MVIDNGGRPRDWVVIDDGPSPLPVGWPGAPLTAMQLRRRSAQEAALKAGRHAPPPAMDEAERDLRLRMAAPALADALATLYRVCRDMDLDDQRERPTEQEYQDAMQRAHAALEQCGVRP